MKISAGFLQFNPILGEEQKNINQISELLKKARNADLIVLPELANSGYNFESKAQAIELAQEIERSQYIEFLIKKAKDNGYYIVSGFHEKENSLLYNTAVLIGPNGLLGKYRKIHLFMNEFDIFEKGNLGLPVFKIKNIKIGILICFDWVFPEVWRIMALKGADMICHPSNLVLPYAQQAVPVHGMINRIFCITANRYGTEKEISFSGQSMISNPTGETLYKAQPNRDEVKIMELNINEARNKNFTHRNHAFNDRLPSEYNDILI
jgi:predicted amidohydrolase